MASIIKNEENVIYNIQTDLSQKADVSYVNTENNLIDSSLNNITNELALKADKTYVDTLNEVSHNTAITNINDANAHTFEVKQIAGDYAKLLISNPNAINYAASTMLDFNTRLSDGNDIPAAGRIEVKGTHSGNYEDCEMNFYLTDDERPDFNGQTGILTKLATLTNTGWYTPLKGGINLSNAQKIINVPDPSLNQDCVNKQYVDTLNQVSHNTIVDLSDENSYTFEVNQAVGNNAKLLISNNTTSNVGATMIDFNTRLADDVIGADGVYLPAAGRIEVKGVMENQREDAEMNFYVSGDTYQDTAGRTGVLNKLMTLTKDGHLGIGTDAPTSALSVVGTRDNAPNTKGIHMGEMGPTDYAIEICATDNFSNSFIDFTYPNVDYGGRILYNHATKKFEIQTNGSNTLPITINADKTISGVADPSLNQDVGTKKYIDDKTENIYIDGSNVGIGTDTPQGALSIVGDTIYSPAVEGIHFGKDVTNYQVMEMSSTYGGYLDFAAPDEGHRGRIQYIMPRVGIEERMNLNAGNAVRMTILSDGKVGIGTETPDGALSIIGSTIISPTNEGIHFGEDLNGYQVMEMSSSVKGGYIDFSYPNQDFRGRIAYQHDNDKFEFTTNGSKKMELLSNGDLNLMNNNRIVNVADPSLNQDVATKNYVDTEIQNSIVSGGGMLATRGTVNGTTVTSTGISSTEVTLLSVNVPILGTGSFSCNIKFPYFSTSNTNARVSYGVRYKQNNLASWNGVETEWLEEKNDVNSYRPMTTVHCTNMFGSTTSINFEVRVKTRVYTTDITTSNLEVEYFNQTYTS